MYKFVTRFTPVFILITLTAMGIAGVMGSSASFNAASPVPTSGDYNHAVTILRQECGENQGQTSIMLTNLQFAPDQVTFSYVGTETSFTLKQSRSDPLSYKGQYQTTAATIKVKLTLISNYNYSAKETVISNCGKVKSLWYGWKIEDVSLQTGLLPAP